MRLPCSSQDLTAKVHMIIRSTIGQHYMHQALTRGFPRVKVQPGSVTFIQRFGSALNLNLHFHCVFLEGVYLDRTEAGLKPRFVQGEPPSDTDIAAVVQKISRRVIRTLRRLGYLEADLDAPAATGYDPLRDDAPELACTMAASVQHAAPLGSGLASRSGALVQALATQARHQHSLVPAVPACKAFRSTPTPRFRPIGATSWNACSGIPPAARCPWSAWHKTPTAISSTRSPIRGRTAPRGFGSRRWNSWRSWLPSCPCRGSTWYAMAAVWHRTATRVGRLSPRHANKAWRSIYHIYGPTPLCKGNVC